MARVSRDFQILLDSVHALYALEDPERFATQALAALQKLIACDLALYGEATPPGPRVRFLAPDRAASPALLARLERSFPAHPLYRHYRQTGDGRARRTTDALTPAERRAYALASPLGRGEEMALFFAGPGRGTIVVLLHRAGGTFEASERDRLELLRPHIVQAHANAVTVSGLHRGIDNLVARMEGPGQAVIVVSDRGRIEHWSAQARAWIARYCKTVFPRPAYRLPECFERWVRDQVALQARAPLARRRPEPLIVPGQGRELCARLIPDAARRRQLLLLEEHCTAAPGNALDGLGLTARERDVLGWLAKGKTNSEIGLILAMSPRTVQKHLEHIYGKLGVETRTMATARFYAALGARAIGAPFPLSH